MCAMDPADESGRRKMRDSWIRMVALGLAQVLLNIVAAVQFLWLLFAGERNRMLTRFDKRIRCGLISCRG